VGRNVIVPSVKEKKGGGKRCFRGGESRNRLSHGGKKRGRKVIPSWERKKKREGSGGGVYDRPVWSRANPKKKKGKKYFIIWGKKKGKENQKTERTLVSFFNQEGKGRCCRGKGDKSRFRGGKKLAAFCSDPQKKRPIHCHKKKGEERGKQRLGSQVEGRGEGLPISFSKKKGAITPQGDRGPFLQRCGEEGRGKKCLLNPFGKGGRESTKKTSLAPEFEGEGVPALPLTERNGLRLTRGEGGSGSSSLPHKEGKREGPNFLLIGKGRKKKERINPERGERSMLFDMYKKS